MESFILFKVCPGGGTGAGRKRRAVSNSTVLEEISVSSTINVVSYQTETGISYLSVYSFNYGII